MVETSKMTLDSWMQTLRETVESFKDNFRIERSAAGPEHRSEQTEQFVKDMRVWIDEVSAGEEAHAPELPSKTLEGQVAQDAAMEVMDLYRAYQEYLKIEIPDERRSEVAQFLTELLSTLDGEFFPAVPSFLGLMLTDLQKSD